MRNSIAMKFLALCLAALSLLTVIGSAAGILGLMYMDLYETSYDEYYENATQSTRQNFAANLVHRYASLELGGLPEQYLNDYYGRDWMYSTYQYGTFFYTIRDAQGRIVESTMADAPGGGTGYDLVVTNMSYRVLVEIMGDSTYGTETTMPETEPVVDTTEDSATMPVSDYSLAQGTQLHYGTYYDHERGQIVEFSFVFEDLPPYTVELYLMPGAMTEGYTWTLLYWIWLVRYELFWSLGIGVLLFAVCMVWLCVAAGRKKDTEEIRAGGLNRLPLDIYLAGLTLAGTFSVVVGCEALIYLLLNRPKVFLPVAAFWGYGLCLLITAFFFACAAQFKTGNGYWWRNSLCGRAVSLSFRFLGWMGRFMTGTSIPLLKKILVGSYQGLKKFILWLFPVFLTSLVTGICRYTLNVLRWIYRKAASLLGRFLGLLPLMWQWLVIAGFLTACMGLSMYTRSEGMVVLSLCLTLAVILYSAGSFGSLMDAAKRMGRGDLDTKVDDRHLTGCFKEFAGDLNALADVAVVAARNQLKSERMKTELITNVSHDIKTPLTSIINYVDLLQKPHTAEEQEVYLEVLSRQSGQLKKLIEDLMEMSKASTGNMAVEIVAVDAAEAVNQALGEFADKLERVQLTPVFRQPEEPVYMKADGRLAWRVLSNLLNNACKYALPGTRLYIDLMELEGKVLISLKNISREELNVSPEELLERFVRGDASRNTEGSGLGLNIAQSLMELQKGQLQLLVDGDLFKVTLVFPGARME